MGGGRWVVLGVRDEGSGVPDGEAQEIFGRVRRGSNAGDVPGSGLGLWSVSRIAEQHGGAVSVSSPVGVGSTLTIRLAATGDGASIVRA